MFGPNLISTEKLLNFMGDSHYLITVLEKDAFAKLIEELSKNENEQQKLLGIINDFTEDKDLVTKKYVDDTIASQPQISFDTEGNLVVTIGGVTKKFKEITK